MPYPSGHNPYDPRMRVSSAHAAPKEKSAFDPFQDVERAQDLAMRGVEGYGAALRPHLLREIGTALGGLNSIGALRSGGTTVALRDIGEDYTQRIGEFAKQASGQAVGFGLEASRMRSDREMAEQDRRERRQSGFLRAIGGVLGAGIGFAVGGPVGAAAGAKIGSSSSRPQFGVPT